ncbi:MAG: hypothetical protein ACI9DJ_001579 [Algoriphagus sp.]|jgi:hypothetical protein
MPQKPILFSLLSLLFLWSTSCENNSEEVLDDAEGPLFTLLYPSKTNITFQNELVEGLNTNILMYEYFYNGGGVATADFNGDGREDIYFTANLSENKLYLNNGDFNFQDITNSSKAGGRIGPWKTGVSVVDINSDGKLDIYLCYSGSLPPHKRVNQLFVNQGNNDNGIPSFKDEAAKYGIDSPGFSNQSYFFDADLDGDLDMLLLNHNPKNLPILNEASTAEFLKKDDVEKGLRFYRQNDGFFTDETTTAGINGSALSYGLGLGISDFNQDGLPDFYVSNDYAVPDCFYVNQGGGIFKNELANSIRHTSQSSMGNDVADINNDSYPDIITLDMLPEDNRRQKLLLSPDNYNKFDLHVRSGFYYQYMRNMLQVNNGNGTFSEVGQLKGVSNTDWSWSALLADYDNDGWKDLFVSNGYLRDYTNQDFIKFQEDYVKQKGRLRREDVLEIISHIPSSNVGNYVFKNQNGESFEDKTLDWGLSESSNSNGAAYADLDNDGDLDLIVNNINRTAFVFRNDAKNNFLKIKLIGRKGNTLGIGTKVKAKVGSHDYLVEQHLGRGYLSSISPVINLGLGKANKIDELRIEWPTGEIQLLKDVASNQTLLVDFTDAKKINLQETKIKAIFQEVPPLMNFKHVKMAYRDFDRQSLLINEQSFQGPCMIKGDLNNDGLQDVFIGGGSGQGASMFMQEGSGNFVLKNDAEFLLDKESEDTDAIFVDVNSDGFLDLLVASGGYHQFKPNDVALTDRLYINQGGGSFKKVTGSFEASSTSCLSLFDLNNDGKLDIFVGGGVVPGNYPKTYESYFLMNDGKGVLKKVEVSGLKDLKLVKDAQSADLNGDGKEELILVGEWMGLKVFNNVEGRLKDISSTYIAYEYLGWWNTLEIADLNSDGKPDFLLGNQGLNNQFSASIKEPLELYAKDFDGNGTIDPIFCYFIQGKSYPYITRDELLSQLPQFRSIFTSFASYAEVGLEKLFPESVLKTSSYYKAEHLKTTILLSQKDNSYSEAKLPQEVQYAPVYSFQVLDADKDGQQDVMLFGNNSHSKLRLGKADANYGIMLKGDGQGGFEYRKQAVSGLSVTGDVRSSLWINQHLLLGINGEKICTYKLNR